MESELSLDCEYSSNPTARGYKWSLNNRPLALDNIASRYVITDSPNMYVLTVQNITASDAGVYDCNVTNQCGSDFVAYYVEIIGE